jgi:hypothetical protein
MRPSDSNHLRFLSIVSRATPTSRASRATEGHDPRPPPRSWVVRSIRSTFAVRLILGENNRRLGMRTKPSIVGSSSAD